LSINPQKESFSDALAPFLPFPHLIHVDLRFSCTSVAHTTAVWFDPADTQPLLMAQSKLFDQSYNYQASALVE
jgi:hypothetical protein